MTSHQIGKTYLVRARCDIKAIHKVLSSLENKSLKEAQVRLAKDGFHFYLTNKTLTVQTVLKEDFFVEYRFRMDNRDSTIDFKINYQSLLNSLSTFVGTNSYLQISYPGVDNRLSLVIVENGTKTSCEIGVTRSEDEDDEDYNFTTHAFDQFELVNVLRMKAGNLTDLLNDATFQDDTKVYLEMRSDDNTVLCFKTHNSTTDCTYELSSNSDVLEQSDINKDLCFEYNVEHFRTVNKAMKVCEVGEIRMNIQGMVQFDCKFDGGTIVTYTINSKVDISNEDDEDDDSESDNSSDEDYVSKSQRIEHNSQRSQREEEIEHNSQRSQREEEISIQEKPKKKKKNESESESGKESGKGKGNKEKKKNDDNDDEDDMEIDDFDGF